MFDAIVVILSIVTGVIIARFIYSLGRDAGMALAAELNRSNCHYVAKFPIEAESREAAEAWAKQAGEKIGAKVEVA